MAKTGSPLSCNSLANSCTCISIMSYQQNHYKQHLTWNIHGLVNGPLLSWTPCITHVANHLNSLRQPMTQRTPDIRKWMWPKLIQMTLKLWLNGLSHFRTHGYICINTYGVRYSVQEHKCMINGSKKKSSPITGLDRPWGFPEFEVPRFQDNRNMKVVRLSALRTGRLYPPGKILGTHCC